MFQAAHNCDYYITKCQGKPLAQMQNLLFNMALGFRQLEEEEEATVDAGGVAQRAQERARRVTLKIVCAANRCSWVSCCEMASFIRTGGDARRTHRPVQIFLSRPMYLLKECQRRLQRPAREPLIRGTRYSRRELSACRCRSPCGIDGEADGACGARRSTTRLRRQRRASRRLLRQ